MIELEDVWKVFGKDEQSVLNEARGLGRDDAALKHYRGSVAVAQANLTVKRGDRVHHGAFGQW
jgi:glycine betaine/proline transport system ATP-binding protein